MSKKILISQFKEKASAVSAVIHEFEDTRKAIEKVVSICLEKPACEKLLHDTDSFSSSKIIAAPNLTEHHFQYLEEICQKKGISGVEKGLRNFAGGIEMAITRVDYGIAETGTFILNSNREDTRLASMLCETHVALLNPKNIFETALDAADALEKMISDPLSYTAFITGASRTADIERVLALGVHGPLELHIMLTGANREK